MKLQITNYKLQINSKNQISNVWYLVFSVWILFVFWYLVFGIYPAGAQTAPELLVSWKANNSAPPDYQGKVLPINNSRVTVGVDLAERDRLVDLSAYTIRWYVNDDLKQSGRGLRSFSFVADVLGGDDEVRTVVVGYRGNDVSKTITIPVVNPEVVINAPYPGGLISAGVTQIQALLYFFNISGLDQVNFNWRANGAAAEGAENVLDLDTTNLPSGTTIRLNAEANNIRQALETTSASVNLTIK